MYIVHHRARHDLTDRAINRWPAAEEAKARIQDAQRTQAGPYLTECDRAFDNGSLAGGTVAEGQAGRIFPQT